MCSQVIVEEEGLRKGSFMQILAVSLIKFILGISITLVWTYA